jgi:hypothetical protein
VREVIRPPWKGLLLIGGLFASGVAWVFFQKWSSERERAALFDAHRPAVMAKLEAIERLKDAVAAMDPVTDASMVPGAHPLVMAGYDHRAEANGAVVYQEDLPDLSRLGDSAPHYNQRIYQAGLLIDCARLMRLGVYGTYEPQNVHLNVAREYLEACEKLEYVFVLRTRRFEGRAFSGDVLAFELDTGKHLGGFALDFKSETLARVLKDTSTRVEQTSSGGRLRTRRIVTTTDRVVHDDFGAVSGELDRRLEENLRQLMPGLRWLD